MWSTMASHSPTNKGSETFQNAQTKKVNNVSRAVNILCPPKMRGGVKIPPPLPWSAKKQKLAYPLPPCQKKNQELANPPSPPCQKSFFLFKNPPFRMK